jgi:hypothetical protein
MLPGPRKRRPSRSAKPPSGVLEVAVGVLVIALALVIPLMLLLIVALGGGGRVCASGPHGCTRRG